MPVVLVEKPEVDGLRAYFVEGSREAVVVGRFSDGRLFLSVGLWLAAYYKWRGFGRFAALRRHVLSIKQPVAVVVRRFVKVVDHFDRLEF